VSDETQKAILALDGGGMRGAFTLGFLGKLESLIARETDKGKNFALADYFDSSAGRTLSLDESQCQSAIPLARRIRASSVRERMPSLR
jgi:hypothetical protein